MTGTEESSQSPLLVEPVVAWPRQAEAGCDYLVTVDLRGPLPAPDGTPAPWPHAAEEFTFTVALDGSPHFSCAALGEPGVVLHRFGGTYGPARFRVTAGAECGPASLWLTISNQWGVPVRKAELRSAIREEDQAGPPFRQTLEPAGKTLAPPPLRPVPDVIAPRFPRPAGDLARSTVTISFAGFNRAWAHWIGDRLERRGLRVLYLRWEPPADAALADLLREMTYAGGRVLIVASDWYFRTGSRTREEWDAALRALAAPDPSRFAAVRVTSRGLPSGTAALMPADLTGLDEDEAERRLLERLDVAREPLPAAGADGCRFPAAMPDVWGFVPRRNMRFTGREALLDDMDVLLRTAPPGDGVLTLHGMSGVGKTQVAAEYAHRFASEYDVVWWVNGDSSVTCRRHLADLAPRLGLRTGQEYGERLRAVREALRRGEPYARWLIVLDSADRPGEIADLVPSGPGHVIITSRNSGWSEYTGRLLEVPVFAREESVAFIRRRAPRLDEPDADQLAEVSEDLPLLLDQTAGWMNDSELSVDEYVALLEDAVDSDAETVSPDFPPAFRTAWSILLNQLRETAPEAVELLRLCTFFAPGVIPARLLRSIPLDSLPPSLAGVLSNPLLWNRAVGRLRAYSVVRVEWHAADGVGGSFSMHRTVHRIVRHGIPEAQRREFMDAVRHALVAADPRRPTDTRLWPDYAEIIPHLRYADVLKSEDPQVQALVLNCLRYMYLSGEYGAGAGLGDRALRVWRSLLGPTHPRIWELTYHYTNLMRALGDYSTTESLSRAAVDHLRQERGPQDLEHLRAAAGLAADLRGLARYDEALELSQHLLRAYRDVLGAQDPRTLNARNNVAVSLRLLGRYPEALETDHRTMEGRRQLLGARHPWTLNSEIAHALDLRLLGRYTEAESMQVRNVRECRLALGHDNPQTLRAEHNLALCRYRRADDGRDEAGAMLARVLVRGERVLDETHPLTLIFAAARGCHVREHGDIDEARALGETVITRYEAMLPEGHPYIAGCRANQALVLRKAGEPEAGRALAERALAEMIRAVGESHPWTLGCALGTSALRHSAGDVEAAARLSRDTAARAVEALGRFHPLTLSALVAQAADLRALRRRAEARRVEHGALVALEVTLGPTHPLTLSARARTRPHWDFEPQHT